MIAKPLPILLSYHNILSLIPFHPTKFRIFEVIMPPPDPSYHTPPSQTGGDTSYTTTPTQKRKINTHPQTHGVLKSGKVLQKVVGEKRKASSSSYAVNSTPVSEISSPVNLVPYTPVIASTFSTSSTPTSSDTPTPTQHQVEGPNYSFEGLLSAIRTEIGRNIPFYTNRQQEILRSILHKTNTFDDNTTTSTQIPAEIEARMTKQEATMQTILEKLEKITPILTANTQEEKANTKVQETTWADKVKMNLPSTQIQSTSTSTQLKKRQPATPEPERTLIVRVNQPIQTTSFNPLQLRTLVNKALSEAGKNVTVIMVRLSAHGNIVLEVKPGNSAAELKEQQAIWEKHIPGLAESSVKETWSKIVAHSVPTDFIMAEDEQKQLGALREDIEMYNVNVKLAAAPRWLTSTEKRTGKSHSSLVLSFKTPQEAKFALRNRLVIAGKPVKTSEFVEIKPSTQCNNCQQFGHTQKICKYTTSCQLCGEQHQTRLHSCSTCGSSKQCSHLVFKCANCGGAHRANDGRCEVFRTVVRRKETTPQADNSLNQQQ